MVTIAITNIVNGNAIIISLMRIRRLSSQPPYQAASRPIMLPIIIGTNTPKKPMDKSMRVPQTTREKISRP